MYFSYFEAGWGELYFQAFHHPFTVVLSTRLPELIVLSMN